MSFLTVEDFNSVNCTHIFDYYTLDTSNISEQTFNGVLYDFNIVSFTGSQYTFKIENNLWTGRFYVLNKNNEYVQNVSYNYDDETNELIIEGNAGLKLVLLLSNYIPFNIVYLTERLVSNPVISCTLKDLGYTGVYTVLDLISNATDDYNFLYEFGVIDDLLYCSLRKTDLVFNLNETATVGMVNHMRLNVDDDYLPEGSLIKDMPLDITVSYKNNIIPVTYDDDIGDYCFDLDLSDKIDNKPVSLLVNVNEIDIVNAMSVNVNLECDYPMVNSFEEFKTKIVAGADIIEIKNNILFESNIVLPENVYVIGNNYQFDLNKYSIDIKGNTAKFENINFINGSSCFIQEENSMLNLTGCTFVNATNNDKYKGSVISGNNENTITNIYDCKFTNCHHSIYLAGEISINNCKALFNEWNESVDTDYPAFATIYAGNVDITNSIFDIDYGTNVLCENEVNIMFAQSLISLAEEVNFNNVYAGNLRNNDTLPFFNAPLNNQSHIYAKYYYPQIESCVIASSIIGKEDKSVCHSIIGEDWVYKNNVQVTRADWNSENNIRKILWED